MISDLRFHYYFVRLSLLSLTLCGCTPKFLAHPQHTQPTPAKISPIHRDNEYQQGTLGELENREVMINSNDLQTASVEDALKTYHSATSILPDSQQKTDTLKRMADLTVHATEVQDELALSNNGTTALVQENSQKHLDKAISSNIDTMLYKNFMQGMATAKSKEEAAAYLDLASTVSDKVSPDLLHVNYDQAIALYQQVLRSSHNAHERQETYYKLARVYDMAGRTKDSLNTLKQLAQEFPNSPFYVEAEFRIGELYFRDHDYLSAISSYQNVLSSPMAKRYRQQAEYKLGWSYYKNANYAHAVNTFFSFYKKTYTDQQKSKGSYYAADADNDPQRLLHDTARVISLSLIEQSGVSSLNQWFDKNGAVPYESNIYRALGKEYLLQDRFQDAANTFNAYVQRHPTDKQDPVFSTAAIQALQNGGFADLVLPAKENFVQKYGINSPFWQQSSESDRKKMLPYLRTHILDLAKHDHALAQKRQNSSYYLDAAKWYQHYLDTQPSLENELAVRELMAEAYHFCGQERSAITQFHLLAYGYNGANTQAEKAAIFELAAWQALANAPHTTTDQLKIIQDYRNSALQFAQAFPADKRTPGILGDIIDAQLASHNPVAAISTAKILVNLQPPAPAQQSLNAWKVIADAQFDLGQLEEAEVSYTQILGYDSPLLSDVDRKTYKDRLAATIYKEAVQLQNKHEISQSVRTYLRVGDTVPDAALRPIAEFDAATLLLNSEQYAQAIPILESFQHDFPNHELNQTIPSKLGLCYEKTGNYLAAAAEFSHISDLNIQTNPELARESLLHAANLYRKTHSPDRAADLYKKYVTTFPHPATDQAEAENHLLEYYAGLDDTDLVNQWLTALVSTDANAGAERTDRTRFLAAMASFRLAQPDYDNFKGLTLSQPLKDSLTAKKSVMKKCLDDYARILAYGTAEYSAAANYQIATVYHLMASALMASERPAGLAGMELEQYNILLEEQADPFDDKAIHMLVSNTNLVKQGVYDQWIRHSFDELAQLSPGRYNRHEQLEPVVPFVF